MDTFSIEAFAQEALAAAEASRERDGADSTPLRRMEAVRQYMAQVLRDHDAGQILDVLNAAIPAGASLGEMIVHQGDRLTVLFARVPAHFRSAVHNHTVCAAIGQLTGSETSTVYDLDDSGELKVAERVTTHAGEVVTLPQDAIHHIENPEETPSCALHVYAGDFSAIQDRRSLWTGPALQESPFSLPALLRESVAAMKREGNGAGLAAVKAAVPAVAPLIDA